jgi:hypothetical protein
VPGKPLTLLPQGQIGEDPGSTDLSAL